MVFSLAISVELYLECILKQNVSSCVLILFVQKVIGLFQMVLLIQTSCIWVLHIWWKMEILKSQSIFSLIKNFYNVKHNNHIQFNISYKMAVSFKLINVDFPSIFFSNISKSYSRFFVTTICYCISV